MRELGDFSHGLFGMDVSGDYMDGIDPNFLLADAEVDWLPFADNVRTPHRTIVLSVVNRLLFGSGVKDIC
jgi:hypothetical protein